MGAVRRWLAAGFLGLLAILLTVSLVEISPPAPVPASAPASRFSAERAMTHLSAISARPRPIGSQAHADAREYLLRQLRSLGVDPTVQRATTNRQADLGEVRNVYARIPGRASTGTVLLVAHYDSTSKGPGAADDGAGVAAVLEAARAVLSGPRPRNDIAILLTDGEEAGLLGAQAFVGASLLDPRNTVVLNFDARGSGGPSTVVDAGRASAWLLPALSTVDKPLAWSFAGSLRRIIPDESDFSVFRRAGFAGLSFAFDEGAARNRTGADTVAAVDPGSVQDHGDKALSLARSVGERDFAKAKRGNASYFTAFGLVMSYPNGVVIPLAAAAALLFLLVGWIAVRRRGVRLRAVGLAACTFVLPIVVTNTLAHVAWYVLNVLRPDYAYIGGGTTYRPEFYQAGLLVLSALFTAVWYRLVRRRWSTEEIMLGVWAWFCVLALACAFLVKGAAYVTTLPLLVGCLAALAAFRWGGDDPFWPRLALCAAALPAVPLMTPLVDFTWRGLAFAGPPLVAATLVVALALPLVDLLEPRRPVLITAGAAGIAVALVVTGFVADRFDRDHPHQTSLLYAMEADIGKAFWISHDRHPPPWTRRYVPGTEDPELAVLAEDANPGSLADYEGGNASLAAVPAPRATVLRVSRERDATVLRVRVDSLGAQRVSVYADTTAHTIVDAAVQNVRLGKLAKSLLAREPWNWGFTFTAVPPEGIEVELRVRGTGPLPLRLVSRRYGLPGVAEFRPMPTDLVLSSRPGGDTVVSRTQRMDLDPR
ncbi:M20/M25/M40 family metallo-hydrolase [Allokutzneria sp. A3M-2-11 16]|uniref:M20/M25/M40 family metallo-hydrolase n=1 Tax=Allokutzneria sp. A3M-2-11 16 TaxID=2962043 RepID=UPI0020B6B3D7|nr:M20/M25/M40 family metallo-hydrolase [Allokutzneria sp. A3M-2-11 16]MCP3802436.1 M20/M25/M40 family metallo-hydrolase [Allokutzneria sp. A3M-2-11 16]